MTDAEKTQSKKESGFKTLEERQGRTTTTKPDPDIPLRS
jgi:hypothetical protein